MGRRHEGMEQYCGPDSKRIDPAMTCRTQLNGRDSASDPRTSSTGVFHWLVDLHEVPSHATHLVASVQTSMVST